MIEFVLFEKVVKRSLFILEQKFGKLWWIILKIPEVKIIPKEGHEHALFYSIQRRRISVQAVENLVTEYASQVTTFKHITPHKLRSTYGTSLYRQTGDIYLVAEVLGHNDVNTTRKHYAALDDDKKRQAASAVQLHQKKQR